MLKQNPTVITADLTGDLQPVILPNEKMPAVPNFEVTTPTTIRWAGWSVSIAPGVAYRSLDIMLQQGPNLLEARADDGAGQIVVTYQEGSL